jgi:hypothetical protein
MSIDPNTLTKPERRRLLEFLLKDSGIGAYLAEQETEVLIAVERLIDGEYGPSGY